MQKAFLTVIMRGKDFSYDEKQQEISRTTSKKTVGFINNP